MHRDILLAIPMRLLGYPQAVSKHSLGFPWPQWLPAGSEEKCRLIACV